MGKSKHHSPKSRFNWAFPGWCCCRNKCTAEECDACFWYHGNPTKFIEKENIK